jgi:hypothetical protein
MTATKELLLPIGCQLMDAEEMEYTEGGLQLYLNTSYLNKATCTAYGNAHKGAAGRTASEIAIEVYAHAKLYYFGLNWREAMWQSGGASLAMMPVAQWIIQHSNPVDIGNDSAFRVAVFNFIWNHM